MENESRTYVAMEQFVSRVIDVTNRYSSIIQIHYDPRNLSGRCSKFPEYGDFPETYALRRYGPWWKVSEATYQKPYRAADVDPLGVEDIITVRFDQAVIPTKLFIYETYNPGSVVRIWGREHRRKWYLLWEGKPEKCEQKARKFEPPLRKVNTLVDTIQLELNCSLLGGHPCFDAILLFGLMGPGTEFQMQCLAALHGLKMPPLKSGVKLPRKIKLLTREEAAEQNAAVNHFLKLPKEMMLHIFKFLDLRSLSQCARVNTNWHKIANDVLFYENISFKEFWTIVDSRVFDFMEKKCDKLKKLDLSWCGKDDISFPRKLYQFLQRYCADLTHISLSNVSYFNGSHLAALCTSCLELRELRLRNIHISELHFCHSNTLYHLTKLETLDLGGSNLTPNFVIPLLKTNRNLKYLNLDFCDKEPLDNMIKIITEYNLKLKGLSCWKGRRLTSYGANLLGNCKDLEDLDLGWCLRTFPAEDTLQDLATGCRGLRRLILSAWRPLVDGMLFPIIENCTKLEQLDLLSITGISPEFIEDAITRLPNLKFLELSYCQSISREQVETWRMTYPHITIQQAEDTY